MKYEFPFEFVAGANGVINGIPNDLTLHSIETYTSIPIEIPKKPAIYPSRINTNLKKRKWNPNEKSGIANDAIPVNATIIINIGLTMFALTAACPKTRAPTIPMVGPIGDGTLKPASLISSNDTSMIIISNITGNGTISLVLNMEYNSSVGSISW